MEPGNVQGTIHTYRLAAQYAKEDADEKTGRILDRAIKRLDALENELNPVEQKADGIFIQAFKFLAWVTKPFWYLPYRFVRLFIQEKSVEQRVDQVWKGISPPYVTDKHVANALAAQIPSPARAEDTRIEVLIEMAKNYQGRRILSEEGKVTAKELMLGIGVDVEPTEFQGERLPLQFSLDLPRSHITIEGQRFQNALETYKKIKELVGPERVFLHLMQQGIIGASIQHELISEMQKITGRGSILSGAHSVDPTLHSHLLVSLDDQENLHFTYQTPFVLSDSEGDPEQTRLGLVWASREVVIPRKELKHVEDYFVAQEAEFRDEVRQRVARGESETTIRKQLRAKKYQDTGLPDLATGLQVFDSFSKLIGLENGVVSAYEEGLKDLESKSTSK